MVTNSKYVYNLSAHIGTEVEMKAIDTRFQVGEWTPSTEKGNFCGLYPASVYIYTCTIYVVVMGQPLVHIQVCHSSLLCSTFAGAENVSKTRAKGKENSGRKVAKRSSGKENATDSLKTKKPKTKGIQ